VPVHACREGEHFRCPICAADICYNYSDQELNALVEKMKRLQDRELRKSFPMTFGDI
jgi:hypothetical protein